ncbi:MAG: hypothetical protein HN742_29140 [Lentisphaerae bacterium]|jgi:photosystem II stability/assembly factor-like uncharacterized protein|nr:hypothetical protein [Lentisphaerota bacterium]MBT4816437.1 hypothetical protein [Lentisphaerota bacterium]MBT5612479.1 hypothetical protein [Lentisphaerota bacterium]MBT7061906.1 hypothetical protein [Lentisphaerota bacterium]MBT7845974.1 hypothetical protein [Lentisphaerota bacterium]
MPDQTPCLLLAAVVALGLTGPTAALEYTWEQIGPGGGGVTQIQDISAVDPAVMFMTNDMGYAMRTQDGGRTWHAVEHPGIAQTWGPGWGFLHPCSAGLAFHGRHRGLYRSHDDGGTWEQVTGPWDDVVETGMHTASRGPNRMAFDMSNGRFGLMAFHRYRKAGRTALFRTDDSGDTWQYLPSFPGTGVVDLFVGREGAALLVACPDALYHSADHGDSWHRIDIGAWHGMRPAPEKRPEDSSGPAELPAIISMDGGVTSTGGAVYVATQRQQRGQEVAGGLFVSEDAGRTWTPSGTAGLPRLIPGKELSQCKQIRVCGRNPQVAVAIMTSIHRGAKAGVDEPFHHNLYRTTNGGQTWAPVLFRHPQMARYNIVTKTWLTNRWGSLAGIRTVAICDSDADIMVATDWARNFRTEDGGVTWREMHAAHVADPEGPTPTGGTPVLNINGYAIHPKSPELHVLSAMDFWGFTSRDRGRTWTHPAFPKTGNNLYAILLDPDIPERVWAGASVAHDIPLKGGHYIKQARNWGGLLCSDDFGESWGWDSWGDDCKGLPKGLITGIVLNPDSPVDRRQLWVSHFSKGVFESLDHGRTWELRADGLLPDALYFGLHRAKDGTLTTFTLGKTHVFRSRDDGRSWQDISRGKFGSAWSIAVRPNRPDTVFVARCGALYAGRALMRTKNNGETWQEVLPHDVSYVHFHPGNPDTIYATGYNNSALHVSRDGGNTWTRLPFPHWRPKSCQVDLLDDRILYVTASGGAVFRGTRLPTVANPE